MTSRGRSVCYLAFVLVGGLASSKGVQAQASLYTITGQVHNPNGSVITTGVTVIVYCGADTSGAILGSKVSDANGNFSLTVDNSLCPMGNTQVTITFQRKGTSNPQLTLTKTLMNPLALGNVSVPL